MHVLHANWSSAGESAGLHVWVEGAAGGQVAASNGSAPLHPTAVDSETIESIVRSHWPDVTLTPSHIEIQLPTSNGGPLASDFSAGAVAEDGECSIATWRVPTLRVSPEDAIAAFARLADLERPETHQIAHSVRYWAAVAAFVESLLAEQRFIPSLVRESEDSLTATWRPWLHDEDARRRAGALIRAMPAVVRGVVDEHEGRPWPILETALCTMVDHRIRQILRDDDFHEAIDGRDPAEDRQVVWLAGLLGEEPEVAPGRAVATEMVRDVSAWIGELDDTGEDRALRLVFILHAPDPPTGDEAQQVRVPDEAWRLSFHLRPTGSTAILLDAEEIWADPATAAAFGEGKPEELLVAELGRAARIYTRLEAALETAAPAAISFDLDEAHAFLREHRSVLEESGFEVQVPEWWGDSGAGLAARLLVEAPELSETDLTAGVAGGAAVSTLGLDAIVRYRWQIAIGDHVLNEDELSELMKRASGEAALVCLDGRWVEIRPDELAQAARTLATAPGGEMALRDAIQLAYGARGDAQTLPVRGLQATGWVADMLGASTDDTRMPIVDQPGKFLGELRPYQQSGLSWLSWLDRFGLGGCLADDMGLGKTIQLIALLQHERKESDNIGPTLLVVPTSVVANWTREIERFAPEIRVHVQHGPDRPVGDPFVNLVEGVDVVVTTYALISRDRETLLRPTWHRVVLDEAQYIKNPPTKQTSTIRALRTTRRVALTGTPVENRLTELWSIMEFCNPGYLGPAPEFRRRFAVPIERQRDEIKTEQLRRLVRPFVLRRLKTDPSVIDDLPPCVTTREYATLAPEQAALYERTVDEMLGRVNSTEGIQRRGLVLATLVKLKQICNHPALVTAGDDDPLTAAGDDLVTSSGKLSRLRDMLEEIIATGDKVLVFTQFRRMGHLLAAMIRTHLDREALFLHGGTPTAKRQQMIDRFQDPDGGVPVFVLSLKAGGVGLNLTAANHVFHFDRWWNPAVENQATDRAFRIGQTRTVHVHKFICLGTLEERIDKMIEQKMELAKNIVGSGEDWLTEMSTTELQDILALRDDALDTEPVS